MCNLSAEIREDAKLEGILEGRLKGKLEGKLESKQETKLETIKNLMENLHLSFNDAANALGFSDEDRKFCQHKLLTGE